MIKIFVLSKDISFVRSLDDSLDRIKYNSKAILDVNPYELYNYSLSNKADFLIIHNSYLSGYYKLFDILLTNNNLKVIYVSDILDYEPLYNAESNIRFYKMKSTNINAINNVIDIMNKDFEIYNSINLELMKYKEKIEEEKLIRKAKLLLMEEKSINEEEAYKYILKRSMDERISKSLVAKNILLKGGK
jgi:response regulator NasT